MEIHSINNGDEFEALLSRLAGPKDMDRNRPYAQQPHTDGGERGKHPVQGLTLRDIRDCYVRAFILSHPVTKDGTLDHLEPNYTLYQEAKKGPFAQLNTNDLYDLVGTFDPVAVAQNLACEIERMMGIFPNLGWAKNRPVGIAKVSPYRYLGEDGATVMFKNGLWELSVTTWAGTAMHRSKSCSTDKVT